MVVAAVRRFGDIRMITSRTWLMLVCASALIAINWAIYVYAVNNGHVVDAALGYFINPLVSVALGLLIFRERLNRAQLVALAIAVIAVVVLTIEVGVPPLVSLGLAFSFGLYGAVKKAVPTDPRVGVGVEAAVAAGHARPVVLFDPCDGDDLGRAGRTRTDAGATLARLRADLAGAAGFQWGRVEAGPRRSGRAPIVIPATRSTTPRTYAADRGWFNP
jgi:EamA-like transporter family